MLRHSLPVEARPPHRQQELLVVPEVVLVAVGLGLSLARRLLAKAVLVVAVKALVAPAVVQCRQRQEVFVPLPPVGDR